VGGTEQACAVEEARPASKLEELTQSPAALRIESGEARGRHVRDELEQAGGGVIVATQNPRVLDYRALSNAGLWCLGRLQTDADRARVLDGLATNNSGSSTTEDDHQFDGSRAFLDRGRAVRFT
jgi:hypothetical protein